MQREPHQNVATVLVDPVVQRELELDLMSRDLWLWPVATAPVCIDGPRQAFQVKQRLLERQRGAWDCAAAWTPVWIGFGDTWRSGDEPLPWSAHTALWRALESRAAHVRYLKRLGGVPPLRLPADPVS
jgi:hypothetical protein